MLRDVFAHIMSRVIKMAFGVADCVSKQCFEVNKMDRRRNHPAGLFTLGGFH